MADLLILKAEDPASAEAPEFQYLFSYCLLQAREVFGSVRLLRNPEGLVDVGGEAAVLVLGPQNILLSARSLAAMRDRLRAGAAEVRPFRLADTGLAAASPVYTLRGFELLERAFLASAGPEAPAPPSHLPTALFAGARLAEILEAVPLAALLRDPSALAGATGPAPVPAGLCHEFIDYYGEVRRDVAPFIPPGTRRVLEIGCGRGLTGEFLQRTFGCQVTGVEMNSVIAREAAGRLHAVLAGDVQKLALGQSDGGFDVVLALELVEHLPEAERFLSRALELVRPGGRVVLSIPNVGHYAIVDDLLAGRWDYLPVGLLCYTHFRFFTRHTLADWLRRCGFESFDIVAQKTELPTRFDALAGAFDLDRESLATKGFYVVGHRAAQRTASSRTGATASGR
ncbi:MAG TPA: class I SAM-dependent methyltransferase [Thermoanaerobaculia bacterium]|nr:class I SAM-dependent methyltransferase [Thermoanaerobaculia bacterium]